MLELEWWRFGNNSLMLKNVLLNAGYENIVAFGPNLAVGYEETWKKNETRVSLSNTLLFVKQEVGTSFDINYKVQGIMLCPFSRVRRQLGNTYKLKRFSRDSLKVCQNHQESFFLDTTSYVHFITNNLSNPAFKNILTDSYANIVLQHFYFVEINK